MANVYSMHVEFTPENKESVEKFVSEKLQVPINNSMFNRHDTSLDINDLTQKEFDLLWNWLDSSGKITDIQGSDYNKRYKTGGMAENKNTEHYRYLDITELPDGLKLELNEEGRQEAKEMMDANRDRTYIWSELFDDVQGNSEYVFHNDIGESGFGLTSAEGITDGYHYVGERDNMYDTDYPESAEVYWFPNYQVENPLETLIENGSVVFTKASSFKTGGMADKKWFQKAIAETGTLNLGGWKKTQGPTVRRGHAYFSHKVDGKSEHDIALSTAYALQALANVTQDAETKKKAKSDANYFFKMAKESKRKRVGKKMSKGGFYHGGGDVPVHKYVYRMYEERGHLTASVESIPDGKYLWEYDSENEESSPVENGFMRHWEDISGLEKYLTDLKIIPNDAEILSEPDAVKRYDYYNKGGSLYNTGGTTTLYSITNDGVPVLTDVPAHEIINYANVLGTYEQWDNDDHEFTTIEDAIKYIEQGDFKVTKKYNAGGTTQSVITKFKNWLNEEI